MNQVTAKLMWNNACTEVVGEEAVKPTALGCMMVPLGVSWDLQISSPFWDKVSKFLRDWADAIDGAHEWTSL